jgi:hypothetical protein
MLSTFKFTDQASQTDEIASWRTYTDPHGQFTIKFPNDWTSVETEGNIKLLPPGSTPVYANGPALLDPYLNLALMQAVGRGVEPVRQYQLTIGGQTTAKYYETETKGIIKAISAPNGELLSVTFQLPQSSESRTSTDSTFDKILSTLRF